MAVAVVVVLASRFRFSHDFVPPVSANSDSRVGMTEQIAPGAGAEPFSATTAFPAVLPSNRSERQFTEQFNEIMELGDPMRRHRMLDTLFQRWVVHDATAAAEFARTLADEDLRKGAIIRVMETWAVQDAAAALSWARDAQFASPHEREIAMSMTCTQVSLSDPQEAIRLALDYKLDASARGLLEGLTSRWAEMDFPAASSWVIAQPVGEQRDSLIENIALAMVDSSPVKAAQLVMDQIASGENRNKAILLILSGLAFREPDVAQAWASSFPPGPLRDRALEELNRVQNRAFDGN